MSILKEFLYQFLINSGGINYSVEEDLRRVKVTAAVDLTGEIYVLELSRDTQLLTLRKGGYLIEETKVYSGNVSGEQSLTVAVGNVIARIKRK